MAWPNSQARRVELVVQNAQVSGSGTHSALPVLITRANLPDEICSPTDGNRAQSDGGDIRAAADSAASTQLAIDIVHWEYDTTDGAGDADIEIWVKRDVSAMADTSIWLGYNTAGTTSADAADATFGSEAVWSEAQVSVLMEDLTPVDHSGNHALTILDGDMSLVAGPFGTAIASANSGDRISNTDAALKDIPTTYDFTVESIGKRAGGSTNVPILNWDGTDDILLYPFDGATPNFRTFWRDLGGNIITASNGGVSDDWLWTAFTSRASDDHEAYADGSSIGTSSATGSAGPFSSFNIFRWPGNQAFIGSIAQVVVWKTARSSDWVATRHNNENAPATFIVEGTPESTGGGATPAVGSGLTTGLKLERRRLVA